MDTSMIFGIIFAIVLIVFILVFGTGALNDIFCFSADAQMVKELKNIEQSVGDIYYLAENSGDSHTISLPSSQKICFVNSSNPAPRRYSDATKTWDVDIVYQRIIKNEGYNIWYYGCGKKQSGYSISRLEMPTENNFCATGGSKIYIIKRHDWVEIEPF